MCKLNLHRHEVSVPVVKKEAFQHPSFCLREVTLLEVLAVMIGAKGWMKAVKRFFLRGKMLVPQAL